MIIGVTEMTDVAETRIPCSRTTRNLVKKYKRGGEPYDTLLRKMVAQYEPDNDAETES